MGLGILAVPLVFSIVDATPARFSNWTSDQQIPYALAAALFFGAIATNRVARPVTCYCIYGGASALVLGFLSAYGLLIGLMLV